jgi:fructosamine-3-kinase
LAGAADADLAALLGAAPVGRRRLSGGCLFDVARVDLADGRRVVVKSGPSDVPGHLRLEAAMLADLARAGVPVPAVLGVDDRHLVLQWIEADGRPLEPAGKDQLGGLLARLHGSAAPWFGYAQDTVIGRLHQPNPRSDRWVPFFREHRLRASMHAALQQGLLDVALARRLDRLLERLDDLLVEPSHPSLLHGDLWAGNLLARGGRPVALVDPAVYWGHPEIELSFGLWLGPVDARVLAAYAEHAPLTPGFLPTRRAIYMLYPLLVHLRCFGRTYEGSIRETLASIGL